MLRAWKDLKKQNLLEAVVRVLSRDGLDALTMDNVAKEAGVAKGTLYTYFKNKEDALKAAVDAIVIPMVEDLMGILEGELSPPERIRKMVERHLLYFDQNRQFFRIFINDRMAAQQRIKRYRSCLYHDLLQKTAAVLEEGIRLGQFRPMDPMKLAAVIIEADVALIYQRLLSDSPDPVEQDAALILDVVFHGIQRTS